MVTDEKKLIDNVIGRYRFGTLLVWSGVLAWVPFIFLRAIGEKPTFLLFLPFHLIGVVGGSRLRAQARKELGMAPPKKNLLRTTGHALILLGIAVWVPYLYLKLVIGQPADMMSFLPYHLTGVLGGVLLHVLSYLRGRNGYRRL
jgi:hypothetical protein